MFGVFIRRWKPKRASNDRNESPDESVSPEPPDRPPLKARQVHPEDKTQMLAYDATFRRKSKLKSLPLEEDDNQYINHLANSNLTPVYPLTPNICVEGGKIEFIKTPPESARNSMASPPSSPLFAARGKRDNRAYDEPPTEKFDGDKELLERRIKQLEQHLEEEKSRTQKEKLAVAKLQNKIIKREGQARSDAERERRARGDTEARARAAEADAARITAKLHAAQREISRMEETVRTLLQYKTRADTLKQEKSSLSAALEARSAHYQSQLSRLAGENETLRGQLLALSAGLEEAAGQDEGGDYERCLDDVAHQVVRALLSQKGLREELGCMRSKIRELEAQNKALSSLLVRQLLPQVRPSPASPESLASLAITQSAGHSPHRELQVQVVNYETGASCHSSPGSLPPPDSHLDHRVSSSGSLISFQDGNASPPPAPRAPHLSTEDKRRHQILAEIWTELKGLEVTPQNLAKALSAVDPSLWAPPERPITLNLNMPAPVLVSRCNHRKSKPAVVQVVDKAVEDEIVVESPESGNKDEGYSTMSSDVQADSSRQSEHNQELEDLKEASDETDNQTIVSIGNRDNRLVVMDDATDADGYIYFPVNVSLTGNVRNSYPPSKNILPFQHVMRSFSDSHLCLKFMTGGTPCGEHCFSIASPVPSSPGVLVFDLKPVMSQERNCINPLRRATARAALAGSEDGSERSSWPSTADERAEGSQYDAEYVQHWLKLDDTRSALQQRHRDVIDLEYDRAELEDWSLSLSCEDLRDTDVRRHSPFSEIATPGQISLSTLPSIREDNALELEEDVGECLWNECGFMTGDSEELKRDEELNSLDKHWGYSEMHSPGGSWSSAGDSDAPDGKRSSAALSEDGDCANVGLNFTRDFYRLVKYESTKSLASNSSRGVGLADAGNSHLRVQEVQTVAKQDRDQALQSVLNFIAEQQKYCRDREESDSLPSRPVSEIRELPPPYAPADFDEDSFGPRSEISEERRRPESCGSFSENDSCDIIVDERLASRYCQVSPDLKMIPRFIERDDSYTEVGNYYDFTRIENEENEIDERHLIKVHQKNEINKSIGLNNAANEIIANVLSYDSPVLPRIKMDEKLNDIATNRSTEHSSSALKENNVNIMAGLKHVSVNSDKVLTGAESMTKSSSFSFNSSEIEPTFIDEVLGVCRRSSSILVPVPEEEENLTENGSPQMTESNTTSTSTTETVIVPSKKENKNKSEKSRIPTFLGGKRPPCSPNRSKSKIPVPEHSKTAYGNSMITSETPVTIGPTVPPENIIVKQDHSLSFHEAATSKDVIDELNRMIQQNEKSISTVELENGTKNKAPSNKDSALWRPSGWVHVEKDIDFSDPKARANLLDVMLASSDSSPTSSCGGSSLSDSAEESAGYSRLHRLHRSRRQKKAAALRDRGMAVLRFSCYRRPSIIGRDDFFVRYGKQEQEAVASFDFLEQLSSGTTSMNSSAEETHIKSALENQVSQDSGKASQKSSELKYQESPVSEDSRAVTLSDSCHISYSGSDRSFEDNSS